MKYFEKKAEGKQKFEFLNSDGQPLKKVFMRGKPLSHNWIGHSTIAGGSGLAGALAGRLVSRKGDNSTPTIVGGVLGTGIGGAISYAQPKAPAAITRSITNLYRKILG